MPDQKQIWRVVVPIALLVLVLATTFGMIWHHHANTSADTCPLCHLTMAPSLAGIRACVLVPAGTGPAPHYIGLIALSAPKQVPARAPPA
jgi:hypothetical protein